MKATTKMTNAMATEYSNGLVADNMQVNGRKERCTVRAYSLTVMGNRRTGYGLKDKELYY